MISTVGSFVLSWGLALAGVAVWTLWHRRRPPHRQPWWPAVQSIKRCHADDATSSFHAHRARLVWYSVACVRAGHSLGPGMTLFEGLWQTPEGIWFYMYARLIEQRALQHEGPSQVVDVVLQELGPRRAYNALLSRPRLLAREFPAGLPLPEP